MPTPEIESTHPFEVSSNPADVETCNRVRQLVDQRQADYERWGVVAVSIKDGRAVCSHNPRNLFSPASILKLATSAVALETLGAQTTNRTSVFADSQPVEGTIEGDLILYGRGAPDFGKSGMSKLIRDLKSRGIEEVTGDVVGDESYFKGDGLGDGWTWNEAQWYYGAEASALTYEKNAVTVRVRNGEPSSASAHVRVDGRVLPVETIEAIGVKRKLGTNEIFVWGNGSRLDARIAVNDPPLFAARIFLERLKESGINVRGTARSVDWTNSKGVEGKTELASVKGAVLSEIVRRMNKDSVNLYAELLLRSVGKRHGNDAPDPDPKMNLLRGDDLAGAAYVKKWITDRSVATKRIAIHDGSGLSRLNRVTPESFVRVLIHAANSRYSRVFTDSLPVAGQDGTMKNRLKRYSGRVLAKTGSIAYANSLAGYLRQRNETLAFVIVCNDETERKDSTLTIDSIVVELMKRR